MNIIEELYYGKISPYEKNRNISKDSKELSEILLKSDKKMRDS